MSHVAEVKKPRKTFFWATLLFLGLVVNNNIQFVAMLNNNDPIEACGNLLGAVRAAGDAGFKFSGQCMRIIENAQETTSAGIWLLGVSNTVLIIMLGVYNLGLMFKGNLFGNQVETRRHDD